MALSLELLAWLLACWDLNQRRGILSGCCGSILWLRVPRCWLAMFSIDSSYSQFPDALILDECGWDSSTLTVWHGIGPLKISTRPSPSYTVSWTQHICSNEQTSSSWYPCAPESTQSNVIVFFVSKIPHDMKVSKWYDANLKDYVKAAKHILWSFWFIS